jgi:hypothetical protein
VVVGEVEIRQGLAGEIAEGRSFVLPVSMRVCAFVCLACDWEVYVLHFVSLLPPFVCFNFFRVLRFLPTSPTSPSRQQGRQCVACRVVQEESTQKNIVLQ